MKGWSLWIVRRKRRRRIRFEVSTHHMNTYLDRYIVSP